MNTLRPGVLAIRAVNQYRRLDVLTYLGLRYYLENSAAKTDDWARTVATNLVLNRSDTPYFRALHFKDVTHAGVTHREITLPGPNEALAEAALLDECSRHPHAFSPAPCVFSYRLASRDDKSGLYDHYVNGLRARHQAIAAACDNTPDGVVLYTDIQQFYPSIRPDLAFSVWDRQCEKARLESSFRELGEKLINEHAAASKPDSQSILTGPMFSHLIGNLVLRGIDEELTADLPVKYFRYVDDITLVGSTKDVSYSREIIRGRLDELGLLLHDDASPKNIEVPVSEWLEGRNDFAESKDAISWMTLIADLKRFLFRDPSQRKALHAAFRDRGFRIPVQDFSRAVRERPYLERLAQLGLKNWFRNRFRRISVESILYQAEWLRNSYKNELYELLAQGDGATGYTRKRLVPKQRYRAGRLIYLMEQDDLNKLYPMVREYPELYFHSCVMEAVATNRVDQVLELGTNASQAAAQPLRAAQIDSSMTFNNLTPAQAQSLAVLRLNGVPVDRSIAKGQPDYEILRFAETGADVGLMKGHDPFIRELACLHGITKEPRHPALLDSAFDADEDLALDAIEQLQQSISS